MRTKFCFCFLIVFLSICSAAKAQNEPVYVNFLIGDSIKVGKQITVKDSSFFDPVLKPTIKHDYFINNIVSLRINEGVTNVMPDSFVLVVKIKVTYTGPDTASSFIPEKTLTINYNKNKVYDNKSIFYFTSAHEVRVEVLQITSTYADSSVTLPLALLENRMVIQRDFEMSCTNDAIDSLSLDTTTVSTFGELKLTWKPNHVSHMYDVEWTYLDQSAVDAGRYSTGGYLDPSKIFKNNSTRVTTKADTCMIPLLYDGEGILVYRVRGAQIDQNGEVQATEWSTDIDPTSAHWKYHYMGHERGLNWQSSTSYAEEGKRKSVVQYFDGSLRARQVVTRDNTTQTTVVAETLYDKQGRPVIQVMPAPTLSTLIHYTPLFNVKDMNGAEYDKGVYDTLLNVADYCQFKEDSMSVSSGAAQYYSAHNPLKNDGFNQYTPDAHGYAFTQTQYTRDNTGRIYAQGGVDKAFTLGSGKETKYYYFAAKQNELDALFGTEVGDASHYQKNMVRDANGQYSVSYVDMHGRTIATALAGNVPASLDTLSSWRDVVETEQLLTKTNNIINGNSVDFSTSIFMTREDDVTLHYSMAKQSVTLQDCKDSNICYNCLYDLTINVSGDCDSCVTGRNDTTIKFSNFSLWKVDSTCNIAVPIDTTIRLHLREGGYNITKSLSISKLGMDKYRDSVYLLKNTCSNYDSIYRRQMRIIKDSLTCSTDTLNQSLHVLYKDMMLQDMYPLVGQYGDSLSDRKCFSIFNKAYGDKYYYQAVADTGACYQNENGECDLVANSAGVLVRPEQLTPAEFTSNFKESWAIKLLGIHPEYKRLLTYEQFATSLDYDDSLERVDTYAEAVAKGYLNPTNSIKSPANKFSHSADPLFGYSFATSAQAAIEDSLFKYHINGTDTLTAWGFATTSVKCVETPTLTCAQKWNTASNVFNTDSLCTGELDMAWRTFRSVYLKNKRAWVDKYVRDNSGVSDNSVCGTPIFMTLDSVLAKGGLTAYGNSSNQNTGRDSASAFYVSNCNAYVSQWRGQLGSCYNTAQQDTIIKYLLQVCIAGADSLHPFGSSSISPISSYQYQNFQKVFTHYNNLWNSTGSSIDTTTCNSYRIDKPLPYNQPMFVTSQPTYNKPDSCSCSRINTLYNYYQKYSSQFTSFSDYMFKVHGTTISNSTLDSLRNLCNGTITCNYLASPISVPPVLQCGAVDVCINCIQFKQAYDSFTTKYPTIIPRVEETDTTQQLENRIFANYLNNWFGFTKTTQDYLLFKNDCDNAHLLTAANPDNTFTCSNYQKIADKFTQDRISGFWDQRQPLPQDYDSNGCNVTEWTINRGGWLHDKTFKMADFLQSGSLAHPSWDTIHPALAYNYNKIFCANDGFSLEVKLKFPRDSAKMRTYLRAGGDTNTYGHITFELFQNAGYYRYSKAYGEENHKLYPGTYPYLFELYAKSPTFDYGVWYAQAVDTPFVMDLTDWRIFKIEHKSGFINYYVDGSLIKTITPKYTRLNTVGPFDFVEHGYGLQIDWVKLYDENDSLKMKEDFDDCNWTPNPFPSNCWNCEDRFTEIVNAYLDTNFTYSQVLSRFNTCGITIPDCNYTGPTLCGKSEPMNEIVNLQPHLPCQDSTDFAIIAATQLDQIYQDSLIGNFNDAYTKKCLNVSSLENFTLSKPASEYHYTLYYYDQAGNLVKTIPPEGVHPNRDTTWLSDVRAKRAMGDFEVPSHLLPTRYRYNSLNQVVSQQTPDGGLTNFWYDRLGRLVISQNAKQNDEGNFSYTKYDAIGRITEVGQKYQITTMSQSVTRDTAALASWLRYRNFDGDYQPNMVTLTTYDVASDYQSAYESYTPFRQKSYTLRNRVSRVRTFNTLGQDMSVSGTDTTYTPQLNLFTTAIEYSYDVHGSVDSMLNIAGPVWWVFPSFYGGNAFKLITYKYDLVSGKVNEVHYQPSNNIRTYADEFYHRYEYDAENRLTDVYTTDNKAFINQPGLEEHDAHYEYYKHGPLARMVLGQQQVQGLDYAYTIQGWLKGVNSTAINPDYDMGHDGKVSGQNQYVARDEFGFNLNYFTDTSASDYVPITASSQFANPYSSLGNAYKPLFNGNISSMAVNVKKFNLPQLYNYGYDQLNRFTKMDVYRGLNDSSNSWSSFTPVNDYKERVSYDANGNILTYVRHGYGSNIPMDSLTYHYLDKNSNNLLESISDGVTTSGYTNDLKDQSPYNYHFDKIGNLTGDGANSVNWIDWNVYGKINSISRSAIDAEDANSLGFMYDANGNRIEKDVWTYSSSVQLAKREWYVRDAQGKVMAVYKSNLNPDWSGEPFYLKEQYIYGSSRLGVIRYDQNMDSAKANPVSADLIGSTYLYYKQRGDKFFELANHLGNVLIVLSDKKFGHTNGTSYDYFNADPITATDYYPFGMEMPGRTYSADGSYRYGFNGKENDNEVKGQGNQQDYGFRVYDPRIGRFLSIDPLAKKYPWYSPYQFAGNKPTRYKDIDGAEEEGEEGEEEEKEELGEALSRIREQREEKEREELIRLRDYARAHNPKADQVLTNYWNNAFQSASFILTGDGGVRDNKKLGDAWDNLVHEEMLKNPDCIGVARQVSLKVTGMVNGEQITAKIRIDNVGVIKGKDGSIGFDLTEAKYSFEQITVNNILRTLTPEQLKATKIIVNGTDVQILIRGQGSAEKINRIIINAGIGNGTNNKDALNNGSDITGRISEVNVVVPKQSGGTSTQATNTNAQSNTSSGKSSQPNLNNTQVKKKG